MTIDPTKPLTPELLARAIDPIAWFVFDEKGESPYQGASRPWYLMDREVSLAHATRMIEDLVNRTKLDLIAACNLGGEGLPIEDLAFSHLS